MIKNVIYKFKQYRFLFEELVKRDFVKKYKRTVLGILWSILGPLVTLGVMALVFAQFFGLNMEHYIIYIFCGNLLYNFFKESTSTGMTALYDNSGIFSKVNVPKYMFLISKNVSALINFGINIVVLFVFCAIDGVAFSWKFIMLLYPISCLVVFNLGAGLILSALYLMFRDMKYLYDIFTLLLMYLSAIFYSIDAYSQEIQYLFYLNPIYVYICYFRKIILEGTIPKLSFHLIAAAYAIVVLVIGVIIYKKKNYKFLYYI
jgi:ABC-2 type transport system permease protein